MYQITVNGEVVQTTQYPNWVRWKASIESWIVCKEKLAEAILIPADAEKETESYYCNISGKPVADPMFPTAVITKV